MVPSTGTSAPAGWTAIPLFEPEGPFVASGYYHAPLFAGVPSRFLLQVGRGMWVVGCSEVCVCRQCRLGCGEAVRRAWLGTAHVMTLA